MKQFIVLLRGINVGGRNIKMAELKSCLESAGFGNVQTVLQTGNVILESNKTKEALKEQVEGILTTTFSYPARVLVVAAGELGSVISQSPFGELSPEYHRYVIFTENGFAPDLVAEAPALKSEIEGISAGIDVVYWYVQKGMTLDSVFGKYMNKASAKHLLTTRNLNTLGKVFEKCGK